MKGNLILEEQAVIDLVKAGNAEAFAEIVEHYQTPIFSYLYRLTADYEIARDLSQDTFIQAYREINKLKSNLSFKPWLYRIATNCAWQFRRRKRLLSFIPLKEDPEVESPENQSDINDERTAVKEALSRIPRDQRVCLVLHFMEGFKYKEIGETLGISEEAVRKRVARGSQEFKRLYNQEGDE